MNNEAKDTIILMTIIVRRNKKDGVLSALSESGALLINSIYGKGTVKSSYLQNILGLVPEQNKAVITCLLTTSKSIEVLKLLADKFNFDKPDTGIAFTMPVDKLSF